jgi:putative DNA primase/helicase
MNRPPNRGFITVADLGVAKHLPPSFLQSLGLKDLPSCGVGIPYLDTAGRTVILKRRTALAAREGSWWPRGKPLMAYGLDRLCETRNEGCLIIVEGESDCWALWHHRFPALGIPGAAASKVLDGLTAADFDGIENIFVHQEPGEAGERFANKVPQRFSALGCAGSIFVFSLPGIKDPADLHVSEPDAFKDILEGGLARGRLWHPDEEGSSRRVLPRRGILAKRGGLRVVRMAGAPRPVNAVRAEEILCQS